MIIFNILVTYFFYFLSNLLNDLYGPFKKHIKNPDDEKDEDNIFIECWEYGFWCGIWRNEGYIYSYFFKLKISR